MPWYVYLDTTIVVDAEEAASEEEAIAAAQRKLEEWMHDPAFEFSWAVEQED